MIVWAAVGRRCARRGVAAVLHFGDWGAALCGPAWVRRPPASGLRARQTGRVAGISQRVRLGVIGAAAATVLAQAVSALLCLMYAFGKYPELHLSKQDFRAEVSVYAQLLTVRGAYQYLFMSADKITAATIRCGNLYLYVDLSMYFALMILLVFRSGVQGVGHAEFTLVAGCAELITRVLICAFLLRLVNGGAIDASASVGAYIALCFADPGAWILAVVSLLYPAARYLFGGAHKKPSGND